MQLIRRKVSTWTLLIMAVTFGLGMWGGTPIEHGDTLVRKAKTTIKNHGNPKYFVYPGLMIYTHAGVYAAYEGVLRVLPTPWAQVLDKWPWRDGPGHLVTVLFSFLGALAVYSLLRHLTGSEIFAFLGVLLLVSSPLWNTHTHYITVDIPLAALCITSVWVLVRMMDGHNPLTIRYMLVLGGLIGLSAAAKYNGAVTALPVAAAVLLAGGSLGRRFELLAWGALSSCVVFLLCNPFLIFEFRQFWRDFVYAGKLTAMGHPGFSVNHMYDQVTTALYRGWSALPTGLSLLGIGWSVFNHRQKPIVRLVLLLFPLGHLLILLRAQMIFDRYSLPMIPFLAVYATLALFWAYQAIGSRFSGPLRLTFQVILMGLAALAVGFNLYRSMQHNGIMTRTDTRVMMRAAFLLHDESMFGKRVGSGIYCQNYLGLKAQIEPLVWVRDSHVEVTEPYDLIAVDSFTHDRYISDENMKLVIDFSRFTSGRVLIITPFDRIKEEVPISLMSMYSPSLPDLPFRRHPGPYVELYFTDKALAELIHDALTAAGRPCTLAQVESGYYHRAFAKGGPGDRARVISEEGRKKTRAFDRVIEEWMQKSGE